MSSVVVVNLSNILAQMLSAFFLTGGASQKYYIGHASLKRNLMGCGCGSVGRAVTWDIIGLWFKSSHWQNYLMYIFTVNFERNEI